MKITRVYYETIRIAIDSRDPNQGPIYNFGPATGKVAGAASFASASASASATIGPVSLPPAPSRATYGSIAPRTFQLPLASGRWDQQTTGIPAVPMGEPPNSD
jgi:hypothetical protein